MSNPSDDPPSRPARGAASRPAAVSGDLEADVVVVGAGTAGCVITRRLIDAGLSVLLLEAGGPAAGNAAIADPARMHELWDTPADWGYRTIEQPGAHDRRLHLPRGRVVGGSHALNGMIWCRGARADYDTWAYLGNPGWCWAEVEPVFQRIERIDGAPAVKEVGGCGLDVLTRFEPGPVQQAIIEAEIQLGLPLDRNYNDGDPGGASLLHLTIRNGSRLTTADAYLGPVWDHPRLHVLTTAQVLRLRFEGPRCTSVEWARRGAIGRARARLRVVVAAGAIGSPALLQRSGLGEPALLSRLGIKVVAALPGVGKNLQDHWLVPVIASTTRAIAPPRGLPSCQGHLFWRSRPGLATPDLQPIHFQAPLLADWMIGPAEGISLMAGLVRPASRGRVEIVSADAAIPPRIDPRVLEAAEDLDALADAVELCREILAQPALSLGWGATELYPGTLAASRELLADYVRESVVTYHHQAGTCAMGRHEDAVVDPRLSVHGVEGLTVADASVMPTVTTGNTNAPVVMIAEQAAAFVAAG